MGRLWSFVWLLRISGDNSQEMMVIVLQRSVTNNSIFTPIYDIVDYFLLYHVGASRISIITLFIWSGWVNGAMWPTSAISVNVQWGHSSVTSSTISLNIRRVFEPLNTNVFASNAFSTLIVVFSYKTASHSWKFGGKDAANAWRRFSDILVHERSPKK